MSIPIPDIFAVWNKKVMDPSADVKKDYAEVTSGKGQASMCIECGQCESQCPQRLPIIELLKKCREME